MGENLPWQQAVHLINCLKRKAAGVTLDWLYCDNPVGMPKGLLDALDAIDVEKQSAGDTGLEKDPR
jgi:hypothetical protein